MTYLFYSIRASPAQMRCEPSCTAYLFPHFCHRFAPPKTTSLPKKFFSFAYNVVGMCSFLLFVGDFRDLSAKFAIAIYPREGTKTFVIEYPQLPKSGIAIYPREGTKTSAYRGEA